MRRALIKSVNLIGDGLYVGPVMKKWYDEQGQDYEDIHLLTIKNHARSIYDGMGVPWTVVFEAEGTYDTVLDFDVAKAFQICDRQRCHLVTAYANLVGVDPKGLALKPNYKHPFVDIKEELKGLVLVSMCSLSCASRGNPPGPPNKMLPWEKWIPLLKTLREEYPDSKLRLVGGKEDRLAVEEGLGISEEECELLGLPIPETANVMQYGKCIVTVDNGMGHLAASQELNEFLFVPAVLGMHYIIPWGHRGVRPVHVDPVTANPGFLDCCLKSAIKDWKEQDGKLCP